MNKAAIFHRNSREYVLPIGRERVDLRLLCAREDLSACEIVYWKRSHPEGIQTASLRLHYRTAWQDDYRATLSFAETARYIKYYFRLTGADGIVCYFCENGFSERPPDSGHFEYLWTNDADIVHVPAWSRGIVYYQIFPERFDACRTDAAPRSYVPWDSKPSREHFHGGNLRGIQRRLPYLQALGVDCLYLTPIFEAAFNHKYATIDYFRVDPDFGTMEDLRALVQDVHAHGMRILLDGVFNHVGIDFPPFADLYENGAKSAYADWFYADAYPLTMEPLNYACVGDYPYMPKLRTEHPSVRQMILDVMLFWIREAGIDGWRLDVADEVAASTWQFVRTALKWEYPEALLLGETWGDAFRLIGQGDQLDTAMNYLFRDAVLDFLCRQSIDAEAFDDRLQRMLSRYPEPVLDSLYNCLGSHDTPRLWTEAGSDEARVRLAIAFQMCYRGAPAIYYGDEIGMPGENDPDCRGGMVWDEAKQNKAIADACREWIAVRKTHPALAVGSISTLHCRGDVYAFARDHEKERVTVLINRGATEAAVTLSDFAQQVVLPPCCVKII